MHARNMHSISAVSARWAASGRNLPELAPRNAGFGGGKGVVYPECVDPICVYPTPRTRSTPVPNGLRGSETR